VAPALQHGLQPTRHILVAHGKLELAIRGAVLATRGPVGAVRGGAREFEPWQVHCYSLLFCILGVLCMQCMLCMYYSIGNESFRRDKCAQTVCVNLLLRRCGDRCDVRSRALAFFVISLRTFTNVVLRAVAIAIYQISIGNRIAVA
jgi:hypothetical protein